MNEHLYSLFGGFSVHEEALLNYLENHIAKNVGAFLNSDGGKLLFGVDDDGIKTPQSEAR